MDLEAPSDAEENRARLAQNLGKMGDTDYRIAELFIPEDLDVFVPASIANQLRRHATAELDADRKAHWEPTHRDPGDPTAPYPEKTVDFRANVANRLAKAFYERHGATVTAPAFEILPVPKADLMTSATACARSSTCARSRSNSSRNASRRRTESSSDPSRSFSRIPRA